MADTGTASTSSEHDGSFTAKTYKRRWWILLVFSFTSCVQSAVYNTWPPVADALKIGFGWSDSFSAVMLLMYCTAVIMGTFPVMYSIDNIGVRHGMVLSTAVSVLCSAVWLVGLPLRQTWLLALGSFLNGLGSTVTSSLPTVISTSWFSVSERTTATSIASMGYLGTAVAFFAGPYISGANVTASEVINKDTLPTEFVDQLQTGVLNILYFMTALTVVGFWFTIIYFPSQPSQCPSKAQTHPRKSFWPGMKHLLSNSHFWKLTLAYNLPNSIFNSWIPFCSVSFRSLGVDEVTSGWIGFSTLLISSLLSIPISWIADRFKRKLKLFLQLANGLALALCLILALIQRGCISISDHQLSIAVLYILSIGAATCINGFIPIYYELASECAFPVDESLACALLSTLNNVIGVVFFLLLLIPALASDSEWMVWTCVGACALAVPLLFFMKENYYRLDVDTACTQTDEEYRAVAS